jgi:hypothetical protein
MCFFWGVSKKEGGGRVCVVHFPSFLSSDEVRADAQLVLLPPHDARADLTTSCASTWPDTTLRTRRSARPHAAHTTLRSAWTLFMDALHRRSAWTLCGRSAHDAAPTLNLSTRRSTHARHYALHSDILSDRPALHDVSSTRTTLSRSTRSPRPSLCRCHDALTLSLRRSSRPSLCHTLSRRSLRRSLRRSPRRSLCPTLCTTLSTTRSLALFLHDVLSATRCLCHTLSRRSIHMTSHTTFTHARPHTLGLS